MAPTRKSRLWAACSNATVVRFLTGYDVASTDGYVVDVGPELVLILTIYDRIRFDGFECHLISDIKRLQVPAPCEDFVVAALRRRGESVDGPPKIDLGSVDSVLFSASKLFPLVVIEIGHKKRDVCFVGRVRDVSKGRLLLHEIGPDAVWEKKTSRFWLKDITRVTFGSGYAEALYLVGGEPGKIKQSKDRKKSEGKNKKVTSRKGNAQ